MKSLVLAAILAVLATAFTSSAQATAPVQVVKQQNQKQAEFPGGDEAMAAYFEKKLAKIPTQTSRLLKVKAIIDKTGKVKKAEMLEGYRALYLNEKLSSEEINAAVLKAVLEMPKWKPASVANKAVETETIVPVLLIAELAKEQYRTQQQTLYTYVEQMPGSPNGDYELLKFLSENINYEAATPGAPLEGTIVARFVVSSYGKVKNAEILKSLNPGLDKEVLRLLNEMPRWSPGKMNGLPVNCYYTLPVRVKAQAQK